ncbi:MAG: hypothetical protein GEU95_13770 [Rhizobiales bacterium]|nr:hypothetical protein [Hyphomicrobiales bacterium]
MGTVIGFPEHGRGSREGRVIGTSAETATVIILPVIRIERYTDEPAKSASRGPRRRRRRRISRSKASA